MVWHWLFPSFSSVFEIVIYFNKKNNWEENVTCTLIAHYIPSLALSHIVMLTRIDLCSCNIKDPLYHIGNKIRIFSFSW